MDQAQIPAPGNDLFPMAVPGSAVPPVAPEPCSSRADSNGWCRAGSSNQRQPRRSSSSSSSSSPPDPHQALPYKLQGLQGHWVQLWQDRAKRKNRRGRGTGVPRLAATATAVLCSSQGGSVGNGWQGRDAETTACGKIQSSPHGPPQQFWCQQSHHSSPWNWGSTRNSHGSSEGGLVCATVGTVLPGFVLLGDSQGSGSGFSR